MSRARNTNPNCKRCGANPRYRTSSYCRLCHNKYTADYYRKKAEIGAGIDYQILFNFVEKVKRRSGWVSMHEMLVELIGLHKEYCKERGQWEFLSVSQQIEKMWIELQNLYDTRKGYKKNDECD